MRCASMWRSVPVWRAVVVESAVDVHGGRPPAHLVPANVSPRHVTSAPVTPGQPARQRPGPAVAAGAHLPADPLTHRRFSSTSKSGDSSPLVNVITYAPAHRQHAHPKLISVTLLMWGRPHPPGLSSLAFSAMSWTSWSSKQVELANTTSPSDQSTSRNEPHTN
jgi:hypothetical protein